MSFTTIKPGFWGKTKEYVKGSLDLRKFLRDTLTELGVPAYDPCCPSNNVGYAVRVNSTTGVTEQFNGTTWVRLNSAIQTLTGAGAVSVDTYATVLITTGANALTLAAGTNGQRKLIKLKTDGGDGTLTPSALEGGTTITFDDAGDFVELVYLDSKWNIIVNSGATVA